MPNTRIAPWFLLALIMAVGAVGFFIFAPFLPALVMAAVFAVTLYPVYRWILKQQRERFPSVAALITVVITLALIVTPIAFIGTQVAYEAADTYVGLVYGDGRAAIDTIVAQIDGFIGPMLPTEWDLSGRLSENLNTYAEGGLSWILRHAGSAFSGVAGFLLSLFIFLFALFFLLKDGPRLRAFLIDISPLSDSHDELVLARLTRAVNSVLRGNIAIALIQGSIASVGFFLFGVPSPLLWGSVTAMAALVPGIGTSLVLIPIVLFLFLTGNVPGAIGMAIWGAFAVGLVDNFLSPYLIGTGSQLHPLLILIAVLGGIGFFGAVGIFLGPLTLSLFMALLSIYADIRDHSPS